MPREIDIPILLTSAIQPSANFTSLQDTQIRLRGTEDSMRAWVALGARRLVVCDGSNFDVGSALAKTVASFSGVQIEMLKFRNDEQRVATFGKGFGEGQIVAHALGHSELIRAAGVFGKCTGKLWVENCHSVLAARRTPFLADVTGGLVNPPMIDTRFYVAEVAFYRQWLAHSHERVLDVEGYYLEHAFMDDVRRSGLRGWIARPSMRTVGMSGSVAIFQRRTHFRSWGRDLRNHLLSIRT